MQKTQMKVDQEKNHDGRDTDLSWRFGASLRRPIANFFAFWFLVGTRRPPRVSFRALRASRVFSESVIHQFKASFGGRTYYSPAVCGTESMSRRFVADCAILPSLTR